MDYPEFERLLNMIKNGEEQGGNMWVRSATNAGLLKKESPLVDSMLAGNKGFDPLNLASSPEKLRKYRDAELKHGRLAMLAALGWPVSELLHPLLSFVTGMPNQLALNGKAPSVLNGGLEKFPSFFLGLILVTGTIESLTLTNFVPSFSPAFQFKEGKKLVPGNFGWDPLQISKGTPEDFKRELEFKEINNGRLAMIGITAMALKEFLSGVPIV